eukprot:scaffold516699_cov20-Prasinocladus_malaysianus.AAC.1
MTPARAPWRSLKKIGTRSLKQKEPGFCLISGKYAEVGDDFVAYDYGVAVAHVIQLILAELRQDVSMLIANAVDNIGQRLATTRYELSGGKIA